LKSQEKIIVICGPTGIGKTGFAIKLAKKFNGEIISADSMQIFKYMDIGTAKPSKEEQKKAKHYLIDIALPDEKFNAAKFAQMADDAIIEIIKKDKLPIVAGGTGLYIKALIFGLFKEKSINDNTVNKVKYKTQNSSINNLYEKLKKYDPDSAEKIHANDLIRIKRALEILETTGTKISMFQKKHNFSIPRYQTLKIGLYMDRKILYQKIEKRVDLMMTQGFVEEVKMLCSRGYLCNLKSMQSIGYRHICNFLNKEFTWEKTLELLKRDTRRYAKRQLTWFKKEKNIIWLRPHEIEKAEVLILNFIKNQNTQDIFKK